MMGIMKSIVVAFGNNREIGRDGTLPWSGKMPADMSRFRDLTYGDTVVMGRKTFDSIPERFRPLPDRQNIVLSMGMSAGVGFEIAKSIDEAIEIARTEDVHFIGGENVYRQVMPIVDRIFATEINIDVPDADAHFPAINDQDWALYDRLDYPADSKNDHDYSFLTYYRRKD